MDTKKLALVFERIVVTSIVFLLLGTPLFFLDVTYQGVVFEKYLHFYFWLLVAVAAWLAESMAHGELRVRRTPLDILILAFVILVLLGTFFSVDRWHSVWGFFGDPSRGVVALFSFILSYYLILSYFNWQRFFLFFASLVAGGLGVILVSATALISPYFFNTFFEIGVITRFFGTASGLALYVTLLLPLFMSAIFILWQKEWQWQPKVKITLTVLLGAGILGSLLVLWALYEFVFWGAALGGLLFFVSYLLARVINVPGRLAWLPMLVFMATFTIFLFGERSFNRIPLAPEPGLQTHVSWTVAKEALQNHFLMGVGPANYGYAFSLYRPAVESENVLAPPRLYQGQGWIMESVATLGAIATLLLAFMAIIFLGMGIFLLALPAKRTKVFSLGLWTAVVMLFTAACFVPLPGSLLLLGVLIATLAYAAIFFESGIAAQYARFSLRFSPNRALAAYFLLALVFLACGLALIFLGRVFFADWRVRQAVEQSQQGDYHGSTRLLTRASELYPMEGRYALRLSQEYMILANTEIAKNPGERDESLVATYVTQAVEAGERARTRMSNDIYTVEAVAVLYENAALYINNMLAKAEEAYSQAYALEPHNVEHALKLADLKRQQADSKREGDGEKAKLYGEAEALLQDVVRKEPDRGESYYSLGVIQARLKKYDEAFINAERAVVLEPRDLSYQHHLGVLYQLRGKAGDGEKAEKIFTDILSLDGTMLDARLSLALLYEQQGKAELAHEQYLRVLQALPPDTGSGVSARKAIEQLMQDLPRE